jgi:hypothetical protein
MMQRQLLRNNRLYTSGLQKGWASIVFGETSLLGAGIRILKRQKKQNSRALLVSENFFEIKTSDWHP